MSFRRVDDSSLSAVANAIRVKGQTSDPLVFPDGFVSAICKIQSGGGGGTPPTAQYGDVNFIDYDGTILYSYSLAEAQALTELPALPAHDGLICDGWNWTLDGIKAMHRPVTVGALYMTDDGVTRLYIRIFEVGRMSVPLYFGQTVENGVSIDWGDGSAAETMSGTGDLHTSHTYANPGDYMISLLPADGCMLSIGSGTSTYSVLGTTDVSGKVYCNMLQKVQIGKNVTSIGFGAFYCCYCLSSITIPASVTNIKGRAFTWCSSLTSITIPPGVTSIGSYTFYCCYGITGVSLPDSVTSIGDNAFYYCMSISRLPIPDGVTSIGGSVFYYCVSLSSITLPKCLTSIGVKAFYYCYGTRYYNFSTCTGIPNLSDTNAFTGIPSDCQMLIPSTLYDGWSAAANWATYASYMAAV